MGDKEEKSQEPVIGKAPGHQYDAKSIRVLGGIEAVRLRPAMYIGSTGDMGLHHLVWEVVDNSVDEAMAGHADEINVTVHADDSVTVIDNGRGIPVDMHATEKRPAAEVVLTVLHAGGKFDSETYKVSGGLHGVGVSVVNALSDWLELEISRDGGVWEQTYEKGKPTSKLKQTGKTRKTGTKVTFHPDPAIFDKTSFSFDTLAQRLRELAFLNKGLKITLTDERTEKSTEFRFTGGITEFVKHLNRGKTTLHDSPIYIEGKRGTVEIEIALQYNDTYGENVFAVGVVVLQRDFDFDCAALAFDVDGRIVERGLAAVEMLDEFGDAAGEAKLRGFFSTFVSQRDLQALVQEGEFAKALRQRVEAIGRLIEDGGIRVKRDFRSGFARFSGLLQLGGGLAFFVGLLPDSSVARNFELEPVGERVDYGDADAVQTAGDFVGFAVEFSTGVQNGEDNFCGRTLFRGVHVDRNAAAVVDHRDGIIGVYGDIDFVGVAGHGFVDRIVDHFPNEMVQSHFARRPDVHRRTQAYGFDAAEHSDGFRVVLMAWSFPDYRLLRFFLFVAHSFS